MDRILIATFLLATAILTGCAAPPAALGPEGVRPQAAIVDALLLPLINRAPAPQVLLLGEQHDAPQHQALELAVVESLLRHGRLAALALEMAERGRSTAGLKPDASEAQVQEALGWNEAGWPWAQYGPAIMAAVRDNVRVLGANLPRNQQRTAMRNEALDAILARDSMLKQQEMIEQGHCGLLAKAQVQPMTRIQIARDQAMAATLAQAVAQIPVPGLEQRNQRPPVVLLLSGNGHVNRQLGVPQHLPQAFATRVIRMLSAGEEPVPAATEATASEPLFDATWPTMERPPKDYCADFRNSMQPQAQP